jgi:tRNA (cytidine56-2'-O)-methyltransferase
MGRVFVLRMGHRFYRDARTTAHVALTSRALGCDGLFLADKEDKSIESTVREVAEKFGGNFTVETGNPWRKTIQDWKKRGGVVAHLTVYGQKLLDVIPEIRESDRDLLVVIGAEKMPTEVFRLSDWNVSITSQPMSEVGALAIFLNHYLGDRAFEKAFANAQVKIIPTKDGKRIEQLS